jgi:hypothetical protein
MRLIVARNTFLPPIPPYVNYQTRLSSQRTKWYPISWWRLTDWLIRSTRNFKFWTKTNNSKSSTTTLLFHQHYYPVDADRQEEEGRKNREGDEERWCGIAVQVLKMLCCCIRKLFDSRAILPFLVSSRRFKAKFFLFSIYTSMFDWITPN